MKYELTKSADIPKKSKFGINLDIYPDGDGYGVVLVGTEEGHNQEFYDRKSTFTYIVLEGSGTFFVDDESIDIAKGDVISIQPNTRTTTRGN